MEFLQSGFARGGDAYSRMSERPYHRYVFDPQAGKFVGDFEAMYADEDAAGYDSWSQENLTTPVRRIALAMLQGYTFLRIVDLGCGKGAFTHLLKTSNNYVLGIDGAQTAVKRAREKYRHMDFQCTSVDAFLDAKVTPFDLAVAFEILSYLASWKDVLRRLPQVASRLFVSLWLPEDPLGFVKSFDDLHAELCRYYTPELEVVINRRSLLWLGLRR